MKEDTIDYSKVSRISGVSRASKEKACLYRTDDGFLSDLLFPFADFNVLFYVFKRIRRRSDYMGVDLRDCTICNDMDAVHSLHEKSRSV